jgi:hypothetical protein
VGVGEGGGSTPPKKKKKEKKSFAICQGLLQQYTQRIVTRVLLDVSLLCGQDNMTYGITS